MKNRLKNNGAIGRRMFPYLFLAVFTGIICWLFVGRHGMFASKTDWISQHSVFPDYFRQQFYETGEMFPEFAAGLGGGQNIYNFSYYGLYSPVILPSYLLPSVPMGDYLMAASIFCLAASGMLLYAWLETCGISKEICLASAVMFLLASPMVFQSYRQVMFVCYMPFLCMAFIGVEQYWKKGKTGIYTAGVFLMVMSSFYFSIAGIVALMMYGCCRSRKAGWKWPFFRFFLPVLTAVIASGVLLVPTAYVLFSRSGSSADINIPELFLPDFSIVRFAGSGYGIGLTTGILAVLLTGLFYQGWKERLLSAGCLAVITVPFFSWLLNGGLYVRDKALIPFLPLLCYLTAVYLDKQKRREIPFWAGMVGYTLAAAWCMGSFCLHKQGISMQRYGFLLFESWLLLAFFVLFSRCRRLWMLILPSLACLALFGIKLNEKEGNIAAKSRYDSVTGQSWETKAADILSREQGMYRLEQAGSSEDKKDNINRTWNTRQWITSVYASAYQEDYKNFRENVFQTEQPFRNQLMQPASDNPLFRKLMGVKYAVRKAQDLKSYEINIQEHTAPVIYATDQLLAKDQYEVLPFPYNQTVLMRYAVTDMYEPAAYSAGSPGQGAAAGYAAEDGAVQAVQADILTDKGNRIQKRQGGYSVKSQKEVKAWLDISGSKQDSQTERLLYIQFDVQNHQRNKDVVVDIQKVRNKLSAENHIYYNGNTTFTYVIRLSPNQTRAEVLFGKGDYFITEARCFVSGVSLLAEEDLYQSRFLPDWEKTKGNCISGWINVKNTGYLITSIPYDTGFTVLVDGKHVPVQKVNMAFLGAPVSKGGHQIDIMYHAPGLEMGKLLTCIGVVLWICIMQQFR